MAAKPLQARSGAGDEACREVTRHEPRAATVVSLEDFGTAELGS